MFALVDILTALTDIAGKLNKLEELDNYVNMKTTDNDSGADAQDVEAKEKYLFYQSGKGINNATNSSNDI